MRKLLLIVGLCLLAVGLLWMGQGTGVIDWPQSSFMIRQIQWAGYGAALAALGRILIWQVRRYSSSAARSRSSPAATVESGLAWRVGWPKPALISPSWDAMKRNRRRRSP